MYKSEKYIKVDVPAVAVLYRVCQFICLAGALFGPLYFQDAWALTETPGGMINAWDSMGTMCVPAPIRIFAAVRLHTAG